MKKIGYISGSRIWQQGDWEPSLERVLYVRDEFEGDILKDEWAINVDAGCTMAIIAALNGTVVGTTTAVDNDWATLARALNWSAAQACGIEARIALNTVSDVTIEMGFNDALTEVQGSTFDDYVNGAAGIPVNISDDAAIIGWDFDSIAVFANFTAVSVIAGVPPMAQDMGILPVGGTFYVLKVQFDALGNAYFYINNNLLATRLLAITPADPLTPWLSIRNKDAGIRTHTIDYVKIWQNR